MVRVPTMTQIFLSKIIINSMSVVKEWIYVITCELIGTVSSISLYLTLLLDFIHLYHLNIWTARQVN